MIRDKYQVGFKKVLLRYGNSFDLEEILIKAIKFHDHGKLEESWQLIASSYMDKVKPEWKNEGLYALAHTYYDPGNNIHVSNKPKFPPHSSVSMLKFIEANLDIVNSINENEAIWSRACALAILNHHGGYIGTGDGSQEYDQIVENLFGGGSNGDNLSLFYLAVRILRFCDMKSFSV